MIYFQWNQYHRKSIFSIYLWYWLRIEIDKLKRFKILTIIKSSNYYKIGKQSILILFWNKRFKLRVDL